MQKHQWQVLRISSWAKRMVNRMIYWGTRFYCPICRQGYRRFLPFGVIERPHAQCPGCGSLERHRLLRIALDKLQQQNVIRMNGRMLHVAPETCLAAYFKKTYEYLSVDLDGRKAMCAMDITDIDLPAEYFDAIVCNHVLEHIPNDDQAISELFRILKYDGWASIQVPMEGAVTREDPITDPMERESVYGQIDHVRLYGNDFKFTLENVGFTVLILRKENLSDEILLNKISVECETDVWICSKEKGVAEKTLS
jgi:SAM-dependent methyltransferase